MRLFLGLPWPDDELAARARVWEGRPSLRLVKRENWHVTLRFLGDVAPDQYDDLVARFEAWGRDAKPLTFIDRGWGAFGPEADPRVVVLRLEAMPTTQKSVGVLHKALDGGGFVGDGKAWKPHLTLAYGRGGDLGPWPDEVPGGRAPLLFRRAVLYESELGPGGSTYVERVSLDLTEEGWPGPPRRSHR